MFFNILVGIMVVIAVAASFWGWWISNGDISDKEDDNKNENSIDEETCDEKC